MNNDNVYVYDKVTRLEILLGEVQSDFNMSLTIDGTKDSCSIIVWSWNEQEIEPYTIVRHEKTNTWWICSHDKVERRLNEKHADHPEDSQFIYVHTLELLGAIELLNARDLTDCAFTNGKYTKKVFITRLFSLSNFELKNWLTISAPTDLDNEQQIVGFIKTFENYTLLSALREFLDAYNLSAKLEFSRNEQQGTGDVYISGATLKIIPKTGDYSLTQHAISHFDDVREVKTMDKNSYGSSVISNAENVISSIPKTFPASGGVKCSSTQHEIKAENAIIRLPSKVYKANWLKLVKTLAPIKLKYHIKGTNTEDFDGVITFNPLEPSSFNRFVNNVLLQVEYGSHHAGSDSFYTQFSQAFDNNKDLIKYQAAKASTITLYDGMKIDAYTGEILDSSGTIERYLAKVTYRSKSNNGDLPLIFCDKDTKNMLKRPWQGIAWERGSDQITGFDAFEPEQGYVAQIMITNYKYTDLQRDGTEIILFNYSSGESYARIQTVSSSIYTFQGSNAAKANIQWIVNYIPMNDIKIKVTNDITKNDIQLYNQNGKLTDNFALSKLINSYAKEITSNNITRYMEYRNFDNIPKVGSIVTTSNGDYVISNVSLTFTQNEAYLTDNEMVDFGYFIEGEFTMSKYVATKSLMVNPNTNIRDYGIPDTYNVKRKQIYGDFYTLSYTYADGIEGSYYITPTHIFNFDNFLDLDLNFTALITCRYNQPVNSSVYWYFQLNTVQFDFDKMFLIELDFKDNNIIGYDSQNVYSGFVISRILNGQYDELNTPISYTDVNGNVGGFNIKFLNSRALGNVYNIYGSQQTGYDTFIANGGTLYNASVLIPEYLINIATPFSTFTINENEYNKDMYEVPVFEYICQAHDSENVIIGDNIFKQHEDNCVFFYSYVIGTNLRPDNVLPTHHVYLSDVSNLIYTLGHSVAMTIGSTGSLTYSLIINKYSYTNFDLLNRTFTNNIQEPWEGGNDIAIFRHVFNTQTGTEDAVELLFIAKNVPSTNISVDTGVLGIMINHYKLN